MIQPEEFIPVRPSEFIGGARDIAKVLAGKAARLRQKKSGTAKVLLYGMPGVGKTRLAEMFARELTEYEYDAKIEHSVQIEITNGRNVTVELIREWQDAARYLSVFGKWSVKIVDEMDTCPPAAQDLLLSFLDRMPNCTAFVGTSNLDLSLLVQRFQTRLQQFKVEPPGTDELNSFLGRWKVPRQLVEQTSVGSGGNVRAALLDIQSILDVKTL